MSTNAPRDNFKGGAWLLADMALNIWALGIVKALGLGYPVAQIVFLRAAIGLLLLSPWIIRNRTDFASVPDLPLQILRVGLSAATLTASYFAISRVPLALFTTMNFTRPLVVMVLAALLLRERITPSQWGAAAIAMIGVVIAIDPDGTMFGPGLLALALVILTGSGAVIVTRRLRDTPTIVLMTFYTVGLGLCTLPFALWSWQPIPTDHLAPLLAVGVFAQTAQACFLRAHYNGDAGVLSVLGYVSLPLSTAAGYFAFAETPALRFYAGAALVVLAAASLTVSRRRPPVMRVR
ncbi:MULTISPECIES: DMT family transporter [Marivita]|uniref:DMT family transporter n=1 Tax=Marivita cryptomonadis TaxID=505252 RepID=A0A9Q2NVW7_9RHOB|nr:MULTISPECIES: DMT family transporter [Marivita]MCR9170143.1 DMT family transporter [Paracoccaceae bacterium]MBM2321779.1 DMT family transporter [Marivita cryptomonadis]MBM2331594.1 DMT family transporter [Marivita cryptomonadis]MBM2341180.1 DMT family transporter [Marivita cryptomonadis]MBM2345842.1 DMT family transporter [Marivita cryptomonadis]